ncbi:MAG: hypothetical protein ABI411_04595 [Tahibacter sp.]
MDPIDLVMDARKQTAERVARETLQAGPMGSTAQRLFSVLLAGATAYALGSVDNVPLIVIGLLAFSFLSTVELFFETRRLRRQIAALRTLIVVDARAPR